VTVRSSDEIAQCRRRGRPVCAVFAPPASADVECQYNATTKALGVVWNDDGEIPEIRRRGEDIVVSAGTTVACGAQATVNNTDRIVVVDAAPGVNGAIFDLSGGRPDRLRPASICG
jgi:hypothetical protein